MKKRLGFSMVLAIILILVIAVPAFATPMIESYSEPKSSDYLQKYSVSLTAVGNSELKATFSVIAKNVMSSVGVWEIEVEKKVAGSWTYDRTLSHVYYSNFLKSNAMLNKSYVSFVGVPGTQYRVTIMAYAANSYGSDTKYATSSSAICH